MNAPSFFWHDYETFGRDPRRDRPAQFAGLRTDAELNEVDDPVMAYCQPAPDRLPDPESCLLTGITPQHCAGAGLPEHAFADLVQAQLAAPGTVGVGYNSIKFDDEVTRFLFWRSLLDPYAREWQNQCGRWDLLNVVRCAYAFRPETLAWPVNDQGLASFKLEHLAQANQLPLARAHDALSDVRTTLALARLLKRSNPRLWDFCLGLRDKQTVLAEIGVGRPFWHVSGMHGVQRGCLALVWPLAPHPHHKNEVIVWDLAEDPAQLQGLSAEAIRQRLFVPNAELPEGVRRLPIKTIHINQSPVVVGQLKTLTPAVAQRWGIDVSRGLAHAETLAKTDSDTSLWRAVFERPAPAETPDVDEDLYGGLVSSEDRRTLERLRSQAGQGISRSAYFSDARLGTLSSRYRARNFSETLTADEAAEWRAHCARRVGPLDTYLARLQALQASQPGADASILDALAAHARQVCPAASP
jgi:exodeoxyribonuclease-1